MTLRKNVISFITIAVCILQAAIFLSGCAGSKSALDGDPDELLQTGRYQEAIWACQSRKQFEQADSLRNELREILISYPDSAEPLGGTINRSKTYLFYFNEGLKGSFKLEGSDSLGDIRSEVAAYNIDCLLGINMTPMTVLRDIRIPDGRVFNGTLMYFVRGCVSALSIQAEKSDRMHFFDAVIGNLDRHDNNWLIDSNGRVIAIDHDRTFVYDKSRWGQTHWETELASIKEPKKLGDVYRKFKSATRQDFEAALKPWLSDESFDAFMETRKVIIETLDTRIKTQ